ANQFVNFSKSIMSNGSKGIDYNVFNGCSIQTNPQTRDIFVESTSPKSRNVLQDSTIWDMKTYKSARLGNIEVVKNIIDHVSVPKTKYISQLEVGNTYLIGRFNTRDRKSTRLNSSHVSISYAVFCLKKKKKVNDKAKSKEISKKNTSV